MNNFNFSITEWSAQAVQSAIDSSGMTKVAVSDTTGIPYSTLNRKLAAKAEFTFRELLALADVLRVHPSAFTPPLFAKPLIDSANHEGAVAA